MMNFLGLIRGLSFRELFRLTGIMIRNPLYVFPTLIATKQTLQICDSLYGRSHHAHGRANAFRHALWNILIAQRIYRIRKSVKKSIAWAEKITDLHEELSSNNPLEKAMDLHNNRVGRSYFEKLKTSSEEQVITFLKNKVLRAIKVANLDDIKRSVNELVYISEI